MKRNQNFITDLEMNSTKNLSKDRGLINLLFFLTTVLFFLSCASIPKQAPELSEELGIKINSIEKSHLILLNNFFSNKRELVDEFIVREWIPIFAKEFFSDQKIQIAWEHIVASNSTEDRLKFIVILGPKLQNQINQKRLELIKPLDDLEKEIEIQIRGEYDVAKSINNSLTSFLYSASKVDESRIKYMEMLGVTNGKIDEALTKTDDLVSKLVKVGTDVVDKESQIKTYLSKVQEIKDKIINNAK